MYVVRKRFSEGFLYLAENAWDVFESDNVKKLSFEQAVAIRSKFEGSEIRYIWRN